MAVYFIADTHFGHQNALAFDNRKFKTIEEHDNALIENWNNTVGIDDEVFEKYKDLENIVIDDIWQKYVPISQEGGE